MTITTTTPPIHHAVDELAWLSCLALGRSSFLDSFFELSCFLLVFLLELVSFFSLLDEEDEELLLETAEELLELSEDTELELDEFAAAVVFLVV